MSVSVVVITFKSESTIGKCLDSLSNQTVAPLEKVVVFSHEIPQWDGEGLKIIADVGGNQSHGRNAGFRATKGDYVAFLDSDCIAPPRWIEAIESNAKRGVTAMGGPYVNAQRTEFANDTYRYLSSIYGNLSASFANPNRPRQAVPSASGGNSAYSRDLYARVGGFDERQNCREEPEFCRKIRESGAEIIFDPEMWVWHAWKGFDSLRALAKVSFNYGRYRIRSPRQIETEHV